MGNWVRKKALLPLGIVCALFLLTPAAAFSWNQATHAYIADHLGARAGHDNLDELWGSVAPDFFNYVFDPATCPGWMSDQAQGTDPATVMKVWNAARTRSEYAFAYGFLSHNGTWGADYVAHTSGLLAGYEDDGYIISKAKLLLQTYGDAFAGLGMSQDTALLVAHVIAEYAIDIRLGSEVDPLLGRKLAAAARNVTRPVRSVLIRAFAADYAAQCFGGDRSRAVSVMIAAENAFRGEMIFLGRAISQSAPVAVQRIAERLVTVLGELGYSVPVATLRAALVDAIAMSDDYMAEVDATIDFVGEGLQDHGITYP